MLYVLLFLLGLPFVFVAAIIGLALKKK
jgi:hypothetical protein